MVLNINELNAKQHEGIPVINQFLQEYQNLLKGLKSAFKERNGSRRDNYNTVSVHITKMKDFAVKNGGIECVELLADYEKNSAIGDNIACAAIEERVITELNFFKEVWISTLS